MNVTFDTLLLNSISCNVVPVKWGHVYGTWRRTWNSYPHDNDCNDFVTRKCDEKMRLNRLATRICASFFDVLCFFSLELVSTKSRSFPGIMSLVSFFDLFFRPFFYVWKGPYRLTFLDVKKTHEESCMQQRWCRFRQCVFPLCPQLKTWKNCTWTTALTVIQP